jgi:hypothetical protein
MNQECPCWLWTKVNGSKAVAADITAWRPGRKHICCKNGLPEIFPTYPCPWPSGLRPLRHHDGAAGPSQSFWKSSRVFSNAIAESSLKNLNRSPNPYAVLSWASVSTKASKSTVPRTTPFDENPS